MQLLWKAVWKFLKKLKIKLPYGPTVTLLGIYPPKLKARSQRNICTNIVHMFIAALFTIAKRWKQLNCPLMDEWINKMLYIYAMEYYSVFSIIIKKEGNANTCYNMHKL